MTIKHEAFVYQWHNTSNGRSYVGFHIGHPDDGYVASSKDFLADYKLNPQYFEREILAYGSSREMQAFETGWLRALNARQDKLYYNKWNNDTEYTENGVAFEHQRDFIQGTLVSAQVQAGTAKKSKKQFYVIYIDNQMVNCNPDWISKSDDKKIQELVSKQVGCTVTWRGGFAYFGPANLNAIEEK